MSHLVLLWGSQWFDENPFPFNQIIIDGKDGYDGFSKGYVYWGKFFRKHFGNDAPEILEPGLREAYSPKPGKELCELVDYEIECDSPVFLYLLNPWFFDQPLTIANVVKAFYTGEELPPPDAEGRPACAYIPHYYFLHDKPVEKCKECREPTGRCKLRFTCNFWFQLDRFLPVPHMRVMPELYNLEYADGQVSQKGQPFDPVAAALYPVLVEQINPVDFFRIKPPNQALRPRPPDTSCKIVIEDKNKGKFGDDVVTLFNRMANDIKSITRIETIRMGNFQRNYFAPHPDKCDVIIGYRALQKVSGNAGLVFRVSSTCSTGDEQELLTDFLNRNYT